MALKLRVFITVIVVLMVCCLSAYGKDIYVAQNAAGANSGLDCANAHATSFFNATSNWGTGLAQIGPGTIVHLCGTVTVAANTTALIFQGSGTSGSPITLLFENGAILQSPVFPDAGGGTGCGGGICMFGRSFITVDGGSNGIIQNTDNGDGKGHNSASTLVDGYKCNNCTLMNLHMLNTVVKVHNGGSGAPGDQQHSNTVSGSHWSIHNNVIDQCGWCVFQNFANGDTDTQIFNNEISNFGHALMYSTAGANASSNYFLHDNYIHDSFNWVNTPNCDYHNDGLHTFTTGGGSMDGLYIYNNWFGGQWTKSTDGTNCATGFIFIESGGFSPSNATNVMIWNNVGVVPSDSYPNTNGWFGLFECRGGNCFVMSNTLIGPNNGSGGDNTLCLSLQKQTNLRAINNVVSMCGNPVEISNSTISMSDYNFFGPSCQNGGNCFMWNGSYKGSFSAWRAASGADAHSTQNNAPSLNADGSPLTGSPIIGLGMNLASFANTNLVSLSWDTTKGNKRVAILRPATGAWDPGSYQMSVSTSGPPVAPTSLNAVVH